MKELEKKRDLSVNHYTGLFLRLKQMDMADPNCFHAAMAAFEDLIELLSKNANECDNMLRYLQSEQIPFLPSESKTLILSANLILNDSPWIRNILTCLSEDDFIARPPNKLTGELDLPSCLGIPKLSALVLEKLDESLLRYPINSCQHEAYAKQQGKKHGCKAVITLLDLLQSNEFAEGLRRVMSHKQGGAPLSKDHESVIQQFQNLEICCVYKIRTEVKFRGTVYPGSNRSCHVLNNMLYIVFHPSCPTDEGDILTNVVDELSKLCGNLVKDSHLQAILRCSHPSRIRRTLDNLRVLMYTPMVVPAYCALNYNAVVKEYLDLILLCNYRKYEQIRFYCSDRKFLSGKIISNTQVESKCVSLTLPPSVEVELPEKESASSATLNTLLICKYTSESQQKHLKSLMSFRGDKSISHVSQDTDIDRCVPFIIPTSAKRFRDHFQNILECVRVFSTPQRYFAIQRLLFQLYFSCFVNEGKPLVSFTKFSALFLNIVKEKLRDLENGGILEDFIKSLELMITKLSQCHTSTNHMTEYSCSPVFSTERTSSYSVVHPSSPTPSRNYSGLPWWQANNPNILNVPKKQQSVQVIQENAKMHLVQATHDLKLIQNLQRVRNESEYDFPYAICFYAHEVIEKGLKALLYSVQSQYQISRSSNIVDLLQGLKASPNCPEGLKVERFDDCVLLVSRHGACCRFPDENHPRAPPVQSHSSEMANNAIHAAQTFMEILSTLECFRCFFPDGLLSAYVPIYYREGGKCMHVVPLFFVDIYMYIYIHTY